MGLNNNQWEYLETTMIGTNEFDAALDYGNRSARVAQIQQNQATYSPEPRVG